MALSLTFPRPGFNFPRSYCRGFVLPFACSPATITDEVLTFVYLATYHISMPIHPHFYAANSNVYSCSHVFIEAECTITVGGIPIDASAAVDAFWVHPQFGLRVFPLATLLPDNTNLADLPQLSSYWNPGA